MNKIIILSALILFLSSPGFAQTSQSDSVQIADIIYDVFDGMRESDTTKMAPHMHSLAKMQSLKIDGAGNKLSELSGPEGWLNAVESNNSGKVWDEQIKGLRIQSDGAVANAWMNYEFYLGTELSHCGVNSFQLIKINGKWKIIYIIDSRITGNCSN